MNHLKIQKPCTENWANMTPTEKGAFCQQCCKQVIDFTKQSPEEIRSILYHSTGEEVCARVDVQQMDELNKDFQAWRHSNNWSMQRVSFYAILFVFGLSIVSCARQEDEHKIQQIHDQAQTIMQKNVHNTVPPKQIEELAQPIIDEVPPPVDEIIEEMPIEIEGEICFGEEDIMVVRSERRVAVLGGVGYTAHYREYLEEVVPHEVTIATEVNIDKNGDPIPTEFNAIAFPNPTNGRTTLKFEVPTRVKADIMVYGMDGSLRAISDLSDFDPGTHEVPFDLSQEAPGTYLITIHSGDFSETVRVIKL